MVKRSQEQQKSIPIPPHWSRPKYHFGQRVAIVGSEDCGVINGLTYNRRRTWYNHCQGWHYEVRLNLDCPGWEPHGATLYEENRLSAL